eukprot:g10792.t1
MDERRVNCLAMGEVQKLPMSMTLKLRVGRHRITSHVELGTLEVQLTAIMSSLSVLEHCHSQMKNSVQASLLHSTIQELSALRHVVLKFGRTWGQKQVATVQLLVPHLLAQEAQGRHPRVVMVGSNLCYSHDVFDFEELVAVRSRREAESFKAKPYSLFSAYAQHHSRQFHGVMNRSCRMRFRSSMQFDGKDRFETWRYLMKPSSRPPSSQQAAVNHESSFQLFLQAVLREPMNFEDVDVFETADIDELARRLPRIPVNCVHPGEVLTQVMNDMHPVVLATGP